MIKFFVVLIFLTISFLAKPVIANDILTAQRLLTELGYAPGPIDGAYGGKTKKAFIKLYTDQNMTFDGIVDKNELDLLKILISKINRSTPKLPKGKNAKVAGKKKALPLLKAIITRKITALELSDYDLCTSLMYADFVDTYMEMKKRNLDCLYISQKQSGWKPTDRNKAFKYLREYQKRYKIKISAYNLSNKTKPFGTTDETTAIYNLLNSNFQNQVLNANSKKKKDFCFDWFAQVSYIAENQSKNIDGSQSWLENSLRDGFVICQDAFNSSYLSALFEKNDLLGVKNVLETWIINDAPRRDVETKNNIFGYVLLINKAFAALEMLKDEFVWSDQFKLKLNKWIQTRALELFPTDLAGKHVTTYCKHKVTNYSHMNEACKNGGILRAQALLRAGIMTNDKEFIELARSVYIVNDKRAKIKKDINLLNNIKLVFKNIDYSKVQLSNNDKKIIFVVGMPRSGTSLVEQILSSHSKIYGAGELPFLKQTILEKFNKEFFMHDSFSNLNKISKKYIENISFLSGTNEYILDKNPLNFIWIGFIKLLFPNAKIIHVKRNSKDTCFSCFKELFENLHFTHDQYDLSTFYNSYIDLMSFWNYSLKNYIHTVNYEDLVDSTKSNVKQMLNFCELDFEENCLNFKENKSAVRTISISQVRNPIYKSSVGSYKYYEGNLKVLFDNLK